MFWSCGCLLAYFAITLASLIGCGEAIFFIYLSKIPVSYRLTKQIGSHATSAVASAAQTTSREILSAVRAFSVAHLLIYFAFQA